jgi:hypothetical protein
MTQINTSGLGMTVLGITVRSEAKTSHIFLLFINMEHQQVGMNEGPVPCIPIPVIISSTDSRFCRNLKYLGPESTQQLPTVLFVV